jgi:hypothetical protein
LKLRIGIALRTALALMVAATVFVPVAAQAATCDMPSCTSGCCEMQAGAPAPMSMGSCCDESGQTMSSSSCPTGDQRPDFKATAAVPEVFSCAVPLGVACTLGPNLGRGWGYCFISASARGPGDLLAGTRLRI